MWTGDDIPDLKGKTAVVTGGNSGIGYETARALCRAGADVTLTVRDGKKAAALQRRIAAHFTGSGSAKVELLDLADVSQVRTFAQGFTQGHRHLDILINNAGVMIPPPSLTAQGFELQFGVNFLGHFALTGHLFPLLRRTPGARVVTLSSGAATLAGGIDFENLRLEKPYDRWREYAVSKLADILFTYELQRRIDVAGLEMLSLAAHPGVTRTGLQRHIPEGDLEGMMEDYGGGMEPSQGALPILFAACSPSVSGGQFFGPDGPGEFHGYPALSGHSTPVMHDRALAQALWDFALEATDTKFE